MDAINLGFCAGEKWDLFPAKNERELDTQIKSLKFNEDRDFLMSTMRCHINACRGRYAVEDNCRAVFRHNMAESAQDFFMTWNEQLELFILFVVMTVLSDSLLLFELFKLTVICRILFTVCSLKNMSAVKNAHKE